MIELIGTVVAFSFLFIVWNIGQRRYRKIIPKGLIKSVITNDPGLKSKSYFYGRPGKDFTPEQKDDAYELAKGQCQYKGCGVKTFNGRPNSLMTFAQKELGTKVNGDCHHRIAKNLGGGNKPKNRMWLCQKHNVGIKDLITYDTLMAAKEEGNKIFIPFNGKIPIKYFYKPDLKRILQEG